jgi:hypothetical protein
MKTRLRRLLLTLVAAVTASIAIAAPASVGTAIADGVCDNGHNWDSVHNICV